MVGSAGDPEPAHKEISLPGLFLWGGLIDTGNILLIVPTTNDRGREAISLTVYLTQGMVPKSSALKARAGVGMRDKDKVHRVFTL